MPTIVKIILKRLLPISLLCLLAASSQAVFFFASPSDGPVCASSFPVQFQGGTNGGGGTGPYIATVVDSAGTARASLSTPTVSGTVVNALFDLTGLATGPGTVSIQDSGGTVFTFPFTINGCPPSGVVVKIYGAATLTPGRTWQYVVSVMNYGSSPTTPSIVQVTGTFLGSEISSSPALPFTVNVPIVSVNNSYDTPFDLVPALPSVGFSYTLAAQFTSVYTGNDSHPFNVVGSVDPNDKTGPRGVGAAHYLKGDSMLAYNIVFENDPNLATAPAQRVVITDQLDPLKVDLSTFLFGPITFGSKLVSPPFGVNPFIVTVPYHVAANPATTEADILVQIDGNLDVDLFSPTYGQITWTFQSIDPATGFPPESPLIGFLPPDITSPEGQGGVSFQVFPQVALVTEDTIANQAKITFDFNPAIVTPIWVNAIDKTAPDSAVAPLAASQSSPTFTVSWAGTDAGAGIATYTIFVSRDNGAYSAFLTGTTATSAPFTGQAGHTYSFYSKATDLMGYLEQAPAQADATTVVGGFICPADLVIVSDRAACGVGDQDDDDWAHHQRNGRHRDEGEDHSRCGENHSDGDDGAHGYTCKYWNRCRATGVVLTPPVIVDNGAVASVVNNHPSTTYPLGVTLVTWTVTDTSGHTSTCVQKVTVVASVEVSFRSPLVRKPTSNTIRRGQVVPFKVELENCLEQTVRSGVTVKLQVQGIDAITGTVFQDVIEDANGAGTDGTVTSDGLMQYRNSQWQFNLDTSNFGDPNTVAGSRYYRTIVTVIDNATLAVLGMGTVNLETTKK